MDGGKIKLLSKYWKSLALTYVVFILETFFFLMRPYFLGLAINDLLKHQYYYLTVLFAVHLIGTLLGIFRRRFDTRTFTSIFNDLVLNLNFKSLSKSNAHSNLSKDLIYFLEQDLNYIVEAIFNIVGSIVFLWFYDPRIMLICIFLLVPISIVTFFYHKHISKLTLQKNNQFEKEVEILGTQKLEQIKIHYKSLQNLNIKISDHNATNFGIIELSLLIAIVFSIILLTKNSNFEIGAALAVYSYILKFAYGLETIPYTIQQLAQVRDVLRRI